ncbi:ethanolamine ammonia-lyase reactivating factor EutA [Desulfoluna spongiiphila]|uniref:Reactivating factor of Adenosylcobalamin-dependent ethanolamine ammonia lyase n=1 Tax=Desulfoluna spongiiphila TaxID=419481 RepID=A0A1G5JLG6_9BACT|nr:ethanolamine ammonia-lyase reactivating factor EutA [Desulfoluna spongiiphila]SCY89166.1 Reactivating factor of Adenosylcobalamin-dependent ethanolamine ammonia lyase [Desulfoluna spongiiphila]
MSESPKVASLYAAHLSGADVSDAAEVVTSVGIDIGTTTTQCVISRLTVKNTAPGTLVPRMEITDKEVVYRSAIHFTPITDRNLVDTEQVFRLVEEEFSRAGVSPSAIDTGAVIITGETAKKENARRISGQLAGYAGDFVVATAGGNLESVIAGRGSGASDYSRTRFKTVANIDIGGGTANIGIYRNGKAIDSCCINVGGRLMRVDATEKRILQVTEPMAKVLDDLGLCARPGGPADPMTIEIICRRMAEVVAAALKDPRPKGLDAALLMTDALRLDYEVDCVMISGGVADSAYTSSPCDTLAEIARYGDIGPMLGRQVRRVFDAAGVELIRPVETIRATVIGAGARTVDVSGSTIVADDSCLPLKNVPVVIPFADGIPERAEEIAEAVRQSVTHHYEGEAPEQIAVGIQGRTYLSYPTVQLLAKGILGGLAQAVRAGLPVIVVLEQDSGKVLGQSLRAMNPSVQVICVDQLEVGEGDYIDIGRSLAGGTVVPAVIKTLVFETRQA